MVAINENSTPSSEAIRRSQPMVNHLHQGGIILYDFVNSSPVGNVDASRLQVFVCGVTVDNTPSPPELQAWSDATAPWMPFNSYGGWTEPFDGVLK